jgi:hypothetical protein
MPDFFTGFHRPELNIHFAFRRFAVSLHVFDWSVDRILEPDSHECFFFGPFGFTRFLD